eukprot:2827007-Rhodomonas_salina.2
MSDGVVRSEREMCELKLGSERGRSQLKDSSGDAGMLRKLENTFVRRCSGEKGARGLRRERGRDRARRDRAREEEGGKREKRETRGRGGREGVVFGYAVECL